MARHTLRPYKRPNKKRFQILLVTLALLMISAAPAFSEPPKFSKTQLDKIQENIRNSKNMSDKSGELDANAQENRRISMSNLEKTKVAGFRRSSEEFAQAQQKFSQAGKQFNDAWIQMELGLEHNDLETVQGGVSHHNTGLQRYNEGVGLLHQAHSTFKRTMEEANASKEHRTGQGNPQQIRTSNPPPQRSPSNTAPAPSTSSSAFPVVAVIILLGTVMTSLQALKDPQVYDKFILHPWSIARHGKGHYTLLTSGLIHADAMHLMINLMSFCFFAFMLEIIVGHRNFMIIYFGSLIFSSFVVTVKNMNNVSYRALGASGAIAGVIFSYILYKPNSKIMFMFAPVPIPAPMFAVGYLAYSYFMAKHKYDNIGHDAHLWGAISGTLITLILDPASMAFFRAHLNV